MIIVSDTSPLTNLIQIEKLDLLRLLYNEIVIPVSVFEELSAITHQANIISNCKWIHINSAKNRIKMELLRKEIDRGEAEAIVLAEELQAELLLIDDMRGRKLAEMNSIKTVGLIGVLVSAKDHQFVSEIKSLLDELINKAGFRIAPNLYTSVLKSVNE